MRSAIFAALAASLFTSDVSAYPGTSSRLGMALKRQAPCDSSCSAADNTIVNNSADCPSATNSFQEALCICQNLAQLSSSCLACILNLDQETLSAWQANCAEAPSYAGASAPVSTAASPSDTASFNSGTPASIPAPSSTVGVTPVASTSASPSTSSVASTISVATSAASSAASTSGATTPPASSATASTSSAGASPAATTGAAKSGATNTINRQSGLVGLLFGGLVAGVALVVLQ